MKTIETERLILRDWEADDAGDLYEYAKNPNVGPHGGWKPHESKAESLEIIQTLFLDKYDCWAIVYKEGGKVIGSIGFEADTKRPAINCKELGYAMSEGYWGKGIMTEAAKAVVRHGFEELKLEMVSVYRNPLNKRSGRVIEKCGFTYEGMLRKAYKIYDGSIRDVACYSMTKEEYEALQGKTHYIYIIQCADGTLYTGWTTDLDGRIEAHNRGAGAKYTRGRGPVRLLYSEVFDTKGEALRREKRIKKLGRAGKLKLAGLGREEKDTGLGGTADGRKQNGSKSNRRKSDDL
ncbi:MAG TPA: GNAT family N-acetyltransferase [Anaerovoracaceae bacterium]|nr:GNAT family N-acetyltransferase [Anaerovoracaceae bacterium]